MSALDGALVAVVGADPEIAARRGDALAAAGSSVRACVVNASALSTLSAPGFDAVVLDVGADPESYAPLVAGLDEDARTRAVPRVVVADGEVALRRLSPLRAAALVLTEGGDAAVVGALADLLKHEAARLDSMRRGHEIDERLQTLETRLSTMRRDAQAFAHDARVLCGIILGYAANLRDGIAGPLAPMQAGHVADILSAVGDVTALIERFSGAARAHADVPRPSSIPPHPQARAPSRRALVDLAELVPVTARLFGNVAALKQVAIVVGADDPTRVWCDAMQIKQVVTNLLVNALKFTPPGGRVSIGVRMSRATEGGPRGRRQAEIVVDDDGPGIPPADRERVFERGVRLERDQAIPGTGIGLSVVREVATAHGGSVHVEASPSGGASFVVRLPIDMRARREHGIALIEDPAAARRIVEAVVNSGVRELVAVGDALLSALQGVRAVVVLPRGKLAEIEEELGADADTTKSARTVPAAGGGE